MTLGEQIAKLPPIFEIPLFEMSVADALHVMRDPEAVAEVAERASGVVPECSSGMEQLISSYVASPLARFHRDFYSTGPDAPDTWPETYDRTDLGALPPCARFILEHPNDPLIKPSGMRRIVAVFLSLGWHPRHIAGLIQSKFERDYAWGQVWEGYDPATRGEFHTRASFPGWWWHIMMIWWTSTANPRASRQLVTSQTAIKICNRSDNPC